MINNQKTKLSLVLLNYPLKPQIIDSRQGEGSVKKKEANPISRVLYPKGVSIISLGLHSHTGSINLPITNVI